MREVDVLGVRVEMPTNQPIVLLRERDGGRYLPIWIGVAEATAIFIQLNDQTLPRPMTHDLLKAVIETLGAKVIKILVNDINQNTFFARIFLEQGEGGEKFEIDARPSDAIALALRTKSPIFVAEKVVVKGGAKVLLRPDPKPAAAPAPAPASPASGDAP